MKANQHIHEAEIQKALLNAEADYMDSDWSAMETLLDRKQPIFFLPFYKRKTTQILIAITMITTTILTLALFSNPTNDDVKTLSSSLTKDFSTHKKEIVLAKDVEELDKTSNHTFSIPSGIQTSSNPVSAVTSQKSSPSLPVKPATGMILEGTMDAFDPSGSDSIGNADTALFYKKVVSRYWVDDTYTYKYHDPKYDVEDFWFGFHYTQQKNENRDMWDSIGRHRNTHGFNMQFMSGNILPGEHRAIYAGLDWGMQFYGRSERDEVILNTDRGDRGLSFMRSHINDIMFRGHFEFAKSRFVPYATVGVGARIFSNGQTIKSLLESTEFESETTHSLMTRATRMTSLGAGMRVHISPRVSLDFRYEINQTGEADVIDYSKTTFNGLQYDIVKKRMDLSSGQVKWGIIFDISESEREKVLKTPGHYKEEVQELYLDQNDANKIYIPCPCTPCDDKDNDMEPLNENRDRSSFPIFIPGSGGGSSGGGKSGFPGVKSPPIKH